jgi:hypothetical protein
VSRARGDLERATSLLEEILALLQQIGASRGRSETLNELGYVSIARGAYARAAACLEESLRLSHREGDHRTVANSIEGLAAVAVSSHDVSAVSRSRYAACLLGASVALRAAVVLPVLPVNRSTVGLADAVARGALGEATYAAALAEGRAMSLDQAVAYALDDVSTA